MERGFFAAARFFLVEKKRGKTGGEGGIRTPGTVSRTSVFKTDCFNHSHTSPGSLVGLRRPIILPFSRTLLARSAARSMSDERRPEF